MGRTEAGIDVPIAVHRVPSAFATEGYNYHHIAQHSHQIASLQHMSFYYFFDNFVQDGYIFILTLRNLLAVQISGCNFLSLLLFYTLVRLKWF